MAKKDARGSDSIIRRQAKPPVSWDHENSQFLISLAGVTIKESPDTNELVEVTFKPPVLYVHLIKKVGDDSRSVGLVSPISSAAFVNLEPGQEYEVTTYAMDPDTSRPLPGADATVHKIKGPEEPNDESTLRFD